MTGWDFKQTKCAKDFIWVVLTTGWYYFSTSANVNIPAFKQVILSDGDLSTLANMKFNLELNHLNADFEMSERKKNLSTVSFPTPWDFLYLCSFYHVFIVFFCICYANRFWWFESSLIFWQSIDETSSSNLLPHSQCYIDNNYPCVVLTLTTDWNFFWW